MLEIVSSSLMLTSELVHRLTGFSLSVLSDVVLQCTCRDALSLLSLLLHPIFLPGHLHFICCSGNYSAHPNIKLAPSLLLLGLWWQIIRPPNVAPNKLFLSGDRTIVFASCHTSKIRNYFPADISRLVDLVEGAPPPRTAGVVVWP